MDSRWEKLHRLGRDEEVSWKFWQKQCLDRLQLVYDLGFRAVQGLGLLGLLGLFGVYIEGLFRL